VGNIYYVDNQASRKIASAAGAGLSTAEDAETIVIRAIAKQWAVAVVETIAKVGVITTKSVIPVAAIIRNVVIRVIIINSIIKTFIRNITIAVSDAIFRTFAQIADCARAFSLSGSFDVVLPTIHCSGFFTRLRARHHLHERLRAGQTCFTYWTFGGPTVGNLRMFWTAILICFNGSVTRLVQAAIHILQTNKQNCSENYG
jgi:hypothetical protein